MQNGSIAMLAGYQLSELLGNWSSSNGILYKKLASAIQNLIKDGIIVRGARLPSERELAKALKLSRNTIVAAYDTLRTEGILESRIGGGTWVFSRNAPLHEAQNLKLNDRFSHNNLLGFIHNDDDNVIDFSTSIPFPLEEIITDTLKLDTEEQAWMIKNRDYHPFGYPPLRQTIANHYNSIGIATSSQQILVTGGAQQAILLIASLILRPGDSALIEDPCYPGALEAIRSLNARIEPLSIGPLGVEPEVFRLRAEASRARLAFLTPTFQNPTGAIIPASNLQAILRAAEQNNIAVIDDRTFASLDIDTLPTAIPKPLANWDRSDLVFTVESIGKLFWAGLRIGWIRAAPHHIEKLVRIKSVHDLGTPLVTQAIAMKMINMHEKAVALRRLELKMKRDLVVTFFKSQLKDWKYTVPTGGLFLWVKLPFGDARDLAQLALRQSLKLRSGTSMSPDERFNDTLRIPYILSLDELKEGLQRLKIIWDKYVDQYSKGNH